MKQKTKDKEATSTAPKLVLSGRHLIDNSAPTDTPSEEGEAKAAPIPSSKPRIIVPISDIAKPKSKSGKEDKPATAPELSIQVDPPMKEEQLDETKVDTPDSSNQTEEASPDPVEEKEPASQDTPEEEKPTPAPDKEPTAQLNGTEDNSELGNEDKPNKETQKALKDAEETAERNKKLEESIEKREFFVPINAVAQKRSIKTSLLMTLIVLILAFVLIDLMLDTGTILLIQKVPHTHFFTTSSNNN